MKKIAILQSNYIPWKGYFDLINSVDEFILYDDMQYTRRDWRNRNKIKTPTGVSWLTVPVENKGKYFQKINETVISEKKWAQKHWSSIQQNYIKSQYFKNYRNVFEDFYLNCEEQMLSKINYQLIIIICDILKIKTKIRWSSEFDLIGDQTEKIVNICKQSDAEIYLSGPAAKNYFDMHFAKKNKIIIEWISYEGYSEYTQQFPPFVHEVTILDLIFNTGPLSKNYMKSFQNDY
jgi:hypothetical protein